MYRYSYIRLIISLVNSLKRDKCEEGISDLNQAVIIVLKY